MKFDINYILIFISLIMFSGGIISIRNGYLNKKITERNEIVEVEIIDCYDSGDNNYFLIFKFNGTKHVKRTKGLFCNKIDGKQKFELLTNKEKNRFIFPKEHMINKDTNYGMIFLILSIGIIIYGIKEIRKNRMVL